MRLLALAAASLIALASPAHAAWEEYVYAELGVAKDFPSTPTKTTGTYKAPLAKEAPETIFMSMQNDIAFKLTVVDFTGRPGDGGNLLGEAASEISKGENNTQLLDFPLYDKGSNSVYGLMLSIDSSEGAHQLATLFFNKGRLYIVQASVPAGSPNRASPDLARFMPSIRFHLEGYGFDVATGHDFPLGDDDPANRDTRSIPGYKPIPGYVVPDDKPLEKAK